MVNSTIKTRHRTHRLTFQIIHIIIRSYDYITNSQALTFSKVTVSNVLQSYSFQCSAKLQFPMFCKVTVSNVLQSYSFHPMFSKVTVSNVLQSYSFACSAKLQFRMFCKASFQCSPESFSQISHLWHNLLIAHSFMLISFSCCQSSDRSQLSSRYRF